MREPFKFSRILSVLSIVVALMAVPSIGYTMSYDQGFVDGQSNQVSKLQTDISILSARMGEMEADLFRVNDAFSFESNDSETVELSMGGPQIVKQPNPNCMASCYKQPEVGWRYTF